MPNQIERTNISIIGKVNAGKSSLINLLSGQKDFAIVDPTPGTTADNVITLMEIHSLGPVKIFDTAGVDELGELGEKKKKKTMQAIYESDLILLTFDFHNLISTKDFSIEKDLLDNILEMNKQCLAIFNLFQNKNNFSNDELNQLVNHFANLLDIPALLIDLSDFSEQKKLIDFILTNFKFENKKIDLFPKLKNNGFVLLNIPMDEETPEIRLLRPQEMAVERLLRKFCVPVLYRMDLLAARNKEINVANKEKARYLNLINDLSNSSEGLQLIVTDSQAFDVIGEWTPANIPLTSFSIAMTNFMTYGNLDYLIHSTEKINELQNQDLILIAESCNHNRQCNDIGTMQIPKVLSKITGKDLKFEFSFGRTFPEDLSKYKMIIHCGSCMTDRQKYYHRIELAIKNNIAFTNYGMVFSFAKNKKLFEKALEPFKVTG
jgi:[FeFe] hydrogenase H-cluster maturation GTPase HydF